MTRGPRRSRIDTLSRSEPTAVPAGGASARRCARVSSFSASSSSSRAASHSSRVPVLCLVIAIISLLMSPPRVVSGPSNPLTAAGRVPYRRPSESRQGERWKMRLPTRPSPRSSRTTGASWASSGSAWRTLTTRRRSLRRPSSRASPARARSATRSAPSPGSTGSYATPHARLPGLHLPRKRRAHPLVLTRSVYLTTTGRSVGGLSRNPSAGPENGRPLLISPRSFAIGPARPRSRARAGRPRRSTALTGRPGVAALAPCGSRRRSRQRFVSRSAATPS
jgi:hypothetical protein